MVCEEGKQSGSKKFRSLDSQVTKEQANMKVVFLFKLTLKRYDLSGQSVRECDERSRVLFFRVNFRQITQSFEKAKHTALQENNSRKLTLTVVVSLSAKALEVARSALDVLSKIDPMDSD